MADLPAKLWVIVRRSLDDSEVVEVHISEENALARARALKAECQQPGELVYVVEAPLSQSE